MGQLPATRGPVHPRAAGPQAYPRNDAGVARGRHSRHTLSGLYGHRPARGRAGICVDPLAPSVPGGHCSAHCSARRPRSGRNGRAEAIAAPAGRAVGGTDAHSLSLSSQSERGQRACRALPSEAGPRGQPDASTRQ